MQAGLYSVCELAVSGGLGEDKSVGLVCFFMQEGEIDQCQFVHFKGGN